MQGREAELLDLVEEAASSPTLIQLEFAFRATAAHVAARAGLLERARTTLDTLAAAGLAALPRSSTWQTGMTAIVEAAAALDDGEIARQATLTRAAAHLEWAVDANRHLANRPGRAVAGRPRRAGRGRRRGLRRQPQPDRKRLARQPG